MSTNASQNATANLWPCEQYSAAPHLFPPWYTQPLNVALFVLYILIIVAALVGNVLVCMAVGVNANLRRGTSSYFIVSLALSDIGTALFSMTFDLESLTMWTCWPKGRGETLCIMWTVAYLITVPTSVLNLFVLSIDRYRTLRDPWDRFKESPSMTPLRAIIIIILIWVYCLVFAIAPVLGVKPFGPYAILYDKCIFNISPTTSLVSSFLNFYVPMFAMCWIYYRIYKIAHTQYQMPTGLDKNNCNSISKSPTTISTLFGDKKGGDSEVYEDEEEENESPKKLDYQISRGNGKKRRAGGAGVSGLENIGFEFSESAVAGRSRRLGGVSDDCKPDDNDQDRAESARIIQHPQFENHSNIADASLVVYNKMAEDPGVLTDNSDDNDAVRVVAVEDHKNNPAGVCEGVKQCDQQFSECRSGLGSIDCDNRSPCNRLHDPLKATANTATHGGSNELDGGDDDGKAAELRESDTNDAGSKHMAVVTGQASDEGEADNTYARKTSGESQSGKQKTNTINKLENPAEIVAIGNAYLGADQDDANTESNTGRHVSLEGRSTRNNRKTASNLTAQARPLSAATLGSIHGIRKKRFKVFKKNTKAARTIAVIVSAFLICWVPFTTLSVVMNICEDACYNALPPEIFPGLLLVGYLNSALNPILFSYQNPNFRRAYRKILRMVFSC